MPSSALPMEIAQTQDDNSSRDRCAASAAWKMITSGPAYEITVAIKPATAADSEKSRIKPFIKQLLADSGLGRGQWRGHPGGVSLAADGIQGHGEGGHRTRQGERHEVELQRQTDSQQRTA